MARTVGSGVTRSYIAIFSLTTFSTTDSGRSRAEQIEASSSLEASFWPRSTSDR